MEGDKGWWKIKRKGAFGAPEKMIKLIFALATGKIGAVGWFSILEVVQRALQRILISVEVIDNGR